MVPEVQAVVRNTQTWLRSSWYVQVPFSWLEACVEWLQNEAGGVGHLSQQQINQQVGVLSDYLTATEIAPNIDGFDKKTIHSPLKFYSLLTVNVKMLYSVDKHCQKATQIPTNLLNTEAQKQLKPP